MRPIISSFLVVALAGNSVLGVPNDPPVITVSSMEPYELSNGVIISTSDDNGHVIEIRNEDNKELQAAVFDSEGTRISFIEMDEEGLLDLSQIEPGEYILRVVDEEHNMNMYRIKRAE